MFEATDYLGRRGLTMHAIGGLDLALWDLHGKSKQACPRADWRGKARPSARLRHHLSMAQTEEEVRGQSPKAGSQPAQLQFAADPWWLDDIAHTGRLLSAARRQAGDQALLIVDAALSYRTPAEGLRLYPVYRDVGIWFLEARFRWTTWKAIWR